MKKDYQTTNIINISNDDSLTNIALTGKSFKTRLCAFFYVKEESNLIKIALKSPDPEIREMAIEKVVDEESHIKLVYEDPSDYVKLAAIPGIKTESQRIKIVKDKTFTGFVRAEAIKGIKNQEFLAYEALNDPDDEVREAAIELVEIDPTIDKAACDDSCWFVRRAAIRKTKNKQILFQAYSNEKEKRVKKAAYDKLLEQLV